MKLAILSVYLALPIAFVGCGTPATVSTPPPVNNPQTQAINIDKAIADAISTAVNAAIAERNAGKLSQADTTLVENWAKSAATLDDTIATELASADPWATQKQKIMLMLPLFKIPGTSTTDTIVQAALGAVSAVVGQLQAQVVQ